MWGSMNLQIYDATNPRLENGFKKDIQAEYKLQSTIPRHIKCIEVAEQQQIILW